MTIKLITPPQSECPSRDSCYRPGVWELENLQEILEKETISRKKKKKSLQCFIVGLSLQLEMCGFYSTKGKLESRIAEFNS